MSNVRQLREGKETVAQHATQNMAKTKHTNNKRSKGGGRKERGAGGKKSEDKKRKRQRG